MTKQTATYIMWILLIFTLISLSCFGFGIYVLADYIPGWISGIFATTKGNKEDAVRRPLSVSKIVCPAEPRFFKLYL